jgi:DNA topoisomerase IB
MSSKDNPYIFSINYKNKLINLTLIDINKYLEKFDITTKDLRTWNANVIFLKNFKNEVLNINTSKYNKKTDEQKLKFIKKLIREAIKKTAILLHHTPSICKSSYIYKKILGKIENSSDIIKDLKKNIEIEDILQKHLYSFKKNIIG